MRALLQTFSPVALLLVVVALLAAPAGAAAKPTKGLRYPSLTPDGKSVVFCYRGDIWIAPVDGQSRSMRLTLHEAQETLPRVSPDGKQIAFTSAREGNYDIYLLPVTGGVPKRVTFNGAWEAVSNWHPDGKKILFTSAQDAGAGRVDLYELDLDGGTPRRITLDGGRDASYSPDGKWIVYSRGYIDIYWDNYTGSANFDLYVIPAEGGTPRQLTNTPGNERYPYFSADGKSVYFIAEEKGVANFYSMPLAGGERTQVTKYKGADVHRPNVNWDHKTAVFERVGELFTVDLAASKEKPDSIKVAIESDVRNSGIEVRTISQGGEQIHVSRDGRNCAFTLRGDIWMMPSSGGNGKQLTKGKANDQWPRFSPDGTKIAYCSNKTGNNDIFIMDLRSGAERQVTRNRADDFFQAWSPDGNELVFCSERSGNKDIWIIDIESGQTRQLTRHPSADDDPVFSPDGRFIAFDSGRGGSQAIYVMSSDGSNVRRVTGGAEFFQVPNWSPDGRMLVFETMSPVTGRPQGLSVISVDGGPTVSVARDGQGACWTTKGDYIYFSAERGPHKGIFRVRPPESIEVGERVPFVGSVEVDRRKELGELFDEIWGALNEGFYDKKMHGVDWKAMRKKYRDMAIDAEMKTEFNLIVRQMLAELGASHLGIFGGREQGNSVKPKVIETGLLALDFEPALLEDGTRKVMAVVPGGPADKAGLRIGDVVTRINKVKLSKKTNLDKVLDGTVGKEVLIAFKPRSANGLGVERTAKITPCNWGDLRKLRYNEWEATAKRRVEEKTKTKKREVGYIHLTMMNPENLQKFTQAVTRWNQNKKVKGMILDVRNNGGGNIHNQLIQVLAAKPLARVQMRGRPKMTQPTLYWDKPVIVLINERSFSDAEVFPFMFKEAGLGKLVGVPTAGGVIGTNNITLSDGTMLRIPRTGFWTMEGTNLEGLGVAPDYLIEETPEDRLTGRDPQLDKAIELILVDVEARAKAEAEANKKKKAEAAAAKKAEPKVEPKTEPKPKPEPTPEATQPQVAADARHTLADARLGEWVRYRSVTPGMEGETHVKVTVTKISNGAVYFAQEIEKGGNSPIPFPEKLLQSGDVVESLATLGRVDGFAEIDGQVKGEQAKILMANVAWPDGSKLVMHFTNAVPGYGLLRVEMGKQVLIEAIEWGVPAAGTATEPTPAAEPVPVPVVAKPEPKVEPKVEPKPEPKAEPTPEPEAAAEPKAPVHPIFDAKEGEWIKIKRIGPGGQELEMVLTVSEVTEDEVVLEQLLMVQGREIKGPQVRRPRSKVLAPMQDNIELKGYAKEEVTVGDHTFQCDVMILEDPSGVEMKYYVSNKVPVTGLVRVERDGETVMEIVEWGEEATG